MRQMTLAHQAEFQRYSKKTRREHFLAEMDAVMPWAELLSLVEPHYPTGEQGRKPVGMEIMLRIYFLQQWFSLSDPGVEIISVIARCLLGLMFTVFGLNGFLNFIHQPPPANPLALQFFVAVSSSHLLRSSSRRS
jgi:hypothetical protein